MPKVKTTYACKSQFVVKKFPDEFMKSINNQLGYIAISVTVRFLATNAFLLILIEIRRNSKKRKATNLKILYSRLRKRF